MTSVFRKLSMLGIEPDEFIDFLRESIRHARMQQEIEDILYSPTERIRLEIRLTKIECLIAHMENERMRRSDYDV